jgi:hypothetical protein
MLLLEKGIKDQGALGEHYQKNEQANVSANYSEKLLRAELLAFDIQMVVRIALFAKYLLAPNDLCRDTVSMNPLIFTEAAFHKPS